MLESPNILLKKDLTAKIADVGLAHPLLSRTHLSQMSMKGTWAWQVSLHHCNAMRATPAYFHAVGLGWHTSTK